MTERNQVNQILLICLYGPESTGKSTIAKKLADYFHTTFVPEVARELVSNNQFSLNDILQIGKAQNQRVKDLMRSANRVLFCDTDVITTRIYSEHYLGNAPKELNGLENEIHYDRYFLFDIDVPWVSDGMRDLSNERPQMLEKFKDALEERNIPYTWVRGDYAEREKFLIKEIEAMLS